jgi:hypothetical protein
MLARMWENGTSYTASGNVKLVQPLWKTIWRLLKKLKIDLSYDPAIPLLGIYPKEYDYKDTSIPMSIAALFTAGKLWKQSRYPTTNKWIKKIYLYINGILLSHKKE